MDHNQHGGSGTGMTTTMANDHDSHSGHDVASGGHGDSFVVQAAATILFNQWKTSTWQEMLGSCVAVLVIAILYEGFKMLRDYLLVKQFSGDHKSSRWAVMCSGMHVLQTLLYMVQVFVSLCLMLIFMTFNVWLCLAVIIGAGIGYFLFGFRRLSACSMDDHCN